MLNMGPGVAGLGTRYSTLQYPPSYPPPAAPPRVHPRYRTPEHQVRYGVRCVAGGVNSAVGLKSVAQLSLDDHFSGFRDMTEGYNLVYAGNPNDHKYIPGND